MKHIIIQIESIMKYPPTISLMRILKDLGHEVILLTSEISSNVESFCKEVNAELVNVGYSYSSKNNPFLKLLKIPLINRGVKKAINCRYDDNTLIWIMTSISLKYIGNALNEKRYIMYMYELSQEIRYYAALPFPKLNLNKLFNNAVATIECEYNRAFIAQAWFGLEKLPFVIPNKPYLENISSIREKRQVIQDEHCSKLIEKIKEKKIVLYQGIIDKERPLEQFARAIEKLGDDYAFVVMSSNGDMLKYKGRNTYILPFVTPPHHLEITSWAYIGILIYVPVRGATTSPLNAIYCAPNKIYEYSMFGVPMIGNEIPGLINPLEFNGAGTCFAEMTIEQIVNAVKKIDASYEVYKQHSYTLFDSIDTKNMIESVIEYT